MIGRGAGGRERAVVFGEGRAGGVESVGTADAVDGPRRRDRPVEVRVGLLQGGEVNAVRPPIEQVGVFVEVAVSSLRRAALGAESRRCSGWRRRKTAGRRRSHKRSVCRRATTSGCCWGRCRIEQLAHVQVGQVEHVELLGILRSEVGIAPGAEGDALAIGRPGKSGDAELVALGERLGFRQLLRRR